MTANGIVQLVFYVVVLLALAKPLGAYMARVYEGQPLVAGPRARLARAPDLPRCAASGPSEEMGWKTLRAGDARRSTSLGLLAVYCLAARCRACCR